MDFIRKDRYGVDDLCRIMEILRSEEGCPWDREQDHHSIRKNFLEETYEVLEAIDKEDVSLLQEELGDVLLQVVFHARMEEEKGSFSLDDVTDGICKKLILRHPHVFGEVKADTSDQVLKNWDAIKQQEKHQKSYTDTLTNVPQVLPALMRAEKVQHRASRAGMDFPDIYEAISAFDEVCADFHDAVEDGDLKVIEAKIGEILFGCVNISRIFGLDSEKSLTKSTEQFINRFSKVEKLADSADPDWKQNNPEMLNQLWEQAEAEETDQKTVR
ncbi:MAG: nucleoside triphosphate pyrophosphohydrolase [Massiliimalia sp.]|jgi:tetrapyrrole methylase family protein/MazG family protein